MAENRTGGLYRKHVVNYDWHLLQAEFRNRSKECLQIKNEYFSCGERF